MTTTSVDIKFLWGRAAGMCSNPFCDTDLTVILEDGSGYNIGEMAHVIDRSPNGPSPRRTIEGGSDTYDNLILLCPTCHTRIDRAPEGEYPIELLHSWKQSHEKKIRNIGREIKYETIEQLKVSVSKILQENKMIWSTFGPQSATANDYGSNANIIWNLRKLDKIIPNNHKIVNMIEANSDLLNKIQYEVFLKFKIHASSFENHQYEFVDNYPTFPQAFEEEFN